MTGILPGVAQAIEEIRCTFEGCGVEVEEDGSGGVFVVVTGISLGCPYVQAEIWIGFQITFQYPYADVYPHFTNADLGACAVEVLMLGDWRAAAGEVGFWPECGHLARPTLGWKSQTGRPEGKRFAFHTRSMGTARRGASALAGQHLPQHVATVPIRLMFNAKHTRSHSPRTFAKPRRLNRRNPS